MNEQQIVLKEIEAQDLTVSDIRDLTGIPKGRVEAILLDLKRARLAAKSMDNTWRGFVKGRDCGGYAAAAKAHEAAK